jgi:hypothetical protein
VVFARYYVEIPIDAAVVAHGLTADPQGWLPGLARTASSRGERLLTEVGFGSDVRLEREVEISFREPIRIPTKTILPMSWTAREAAGLFPDLEADLEVAPLGAERSQLSMSARYAPPFGPVGRVLDRALLHRVAEATLKDFLDRVAEALVARLGEAATVAG